MRKDVTLTIRWKGETISMHRKFITPPGKDKLFYTLAELAELYGISKISGAADIDLMNPNMGGDDIEIYDSKGNMKYYVPDLSLSVEEGVFVKASGTSGGAEKRVAAATLNSADLFGPVSSGGMDTMQQVAGLSVVFFVALMLVSCVMIWTSKEPIPFAPFEEPRMAEAAIITAPSPVIVIPMPETVRGEWESNEYIPPVEDDSADVEDSFEEIIDSEAAVPDAEIVEDVIEVEDQATIDRRKFYKMIDAQRNLEKMLRSGQITRAEYDRFKITLLMR
ncbi:MAG: hypothetical protein LBV27_07080 [Oscillospiraceae bacterium]|jgi:hypothetical protein|nr:hypothetical protein [Oscillospiraceae bacterium]